MNQMVTYFVPSVQSVMIPKDLLTIQKAARRRRRRNEHCSYQILSHANNLSFVCDIIKKYNKALAFSVRTRHTKKIEVVVVVYKDKNKKEKDLLNE
jgi:hypothetical protein